MGQKQKMIRQKEQQDLAEEQERRYTGIEKCDQTDSPALRFQTGRDIRNSPASLQGHILLKCPITTALFKKDGFDWLIN